MAQFWDESGWMAGGGAVPTEPMGLLGGMPAGDRTLGLLALAAGIAANNRGRNKGEALQNAIGGGAQQGLVFIQQSLANQSRQKQLAMQQQAQDRMAQNQQAYLGLAQNQDARASAAEQARQAEQARRNALLQQLQGLPQTRTEEVRMPAVGPVADPTAMRGVERQVPLSAEERITQAIPILSQLDPMAAYGMMGQTAERGAAREERQMSREEQRKFLAEQQARDIASRFDLQKQRTEDAERMRLMIAATRPAPQPTPLQIITGQNGEQFFIDPRNPGAVAQPVMGPSGQIIKQQGAGHLTEGEGKGTAFLGQMTAASDQIAKIEKGGFNPSSWLGQAQTALAGGVTNPLAPSAAQQYRQSQEQWAEAYLRIKTGAAATKDEVRGNVRTFFPQPGDSNAVVQQKAEMRKQAENDVRFIAGRGAPQLDAQRGAAQQPAGAKAVDIDALLNKYLNR